MQETEDLVAELEKEYEVHWPPRDTDQDDPIGLEICNTNCKAIEEADVVHIVWDGKSTGSLFDLGMVFALGKKLIVVSLPPETDHKSFQNMIRAYAMRV